MKPPGPYRDDLDNVDADEAEIEQKLNETFDVILERTAGDYGHAVHSVHAKAHGILTGELAVDEGLPVELAQGLFAHSGTHRAYLRMSTNAGDILPDTISLPRGLAVKVLNVHGDRLSGAEGKTQDFIMVNGTAFQANTAKNFLGGLELLAQTTDRMEGTKKVVSATLRGVRHVLESVGAESATVSALGGAPNVEPLGETYYSVTPFRYGDYVAKFSVKPIAPEMTALTGKEIDIDGRENAIREEVRKQMSHMDAVWEFRVQLCRDVDKQPIEDPTVEWAENDAPFQRVGLLRVPMQDSWDPKQFALVNERMRFSVWTGLDAHRPLGNINRARQSTYRHSADFRARVNGCPYHEPVKPNE
jgi:hypothetical protein